MRRKKKGPTCVWVDGVLMRFAEPPTEEDLDAIRKFAQSLREAAERRENERSPEERESLQRKRDEGRQRARERNKRLFGK